MVDLGIKTLEHPPTRRDLDDLPPNVTGEIIEGVLYVHPRARSRHSSAIGGLGAQLTGPFQLGRGGPGGWWILPEPGIELPGSPEVVPDLAAWRRERLPTLPEGPLTIVPDWICEIHSPSTRAYDVRIKRPFYARIGVGHLWCIDRETRTLSAFQLTDGRWMELAIHGENDVARIPPFEAVEVSLGEWWGDPPPEVHEPVAAYAERKRR